ncbi:hypothetical protein HRG_004447 [Hirsutella rhossiliensis]|uniref:Uncharacterized protein n=1 Tax=Hirsutella rhossiliensis TaxID=111463 RepID=A0A9P8N143_9HYPO|nr:uncharacterized protein HRG_04447 [Hirsutella rhossiliensis]KAH0964019.1 hypothetical protein HRG_04447 [Hirsutella rhossiliensis]
MKLLSSLVGFGLVAAALAAPAPVPHVVATDHGMPRTRPSVGRVDTSLIDDPATLTSLAEQLSRYASAAIEHLQVFDISFSVTPVFAVGTDDAEVTTDVDGDLVVVGSGQRVRAIIWNPSTRTFYLDPMSGLSARLPVAILIVSLWLLFTSLYLGSLVRSVEDDEIDPEFDSVSALEARGLLGPRTPLTRESLAEKPALDANDGAAGYL